MKPHWRYLLADWISRGAITRGMEMAKRSQTLLDKLDLALFTLDEIAAMETPGANATVRRMANRAREAVTLNETWPCR